MKLCLKDSTYEWDFSELTDRAWILENMESWGIPSAWEPTHLRLARAYLAACLKYTSVASELSAKDNDSYI